MASSTTSIRPQNGVLPIPATQTSTSTNGSRQAAVRQPSQKLKLIVRRLAPALTEAEFLSVIGEEWTVGNGKVDWFRYEPGKDSKDPAKPSKPSRAYLHLTAEPYLHPFSDVVRQSNFEDAAGTFTSSCLIGPPVVEFAPYNRVPAGKPRVDARAGTIDQDAEFMAFLEGLANPVTGRDVGGDSSGEAAGKPEKVTTTPLVQFLKDKKASKTKDAALKAAKKHESKSKSSTSSTSPEDVKKKGKEAKPERALERAAKEAVKILNREAAKASSSTGPTSAASPTTAPEGSSDTPKLDISKIPIRQRSAATAAHIRMLQRDLGFSPAQAHRQVKRDTADVQKAERAAAVEKAAATAKDTPSATSSQASSTPTAPKANTAQPNSRRSRAKGFNDPDSSRATSNASSNRATTSQAGAASPSTPVILLRKPEATPSAPTPGPASAAQPIKQTPVILARKPQTAPVPSEGATQAFVKHANPSQGVTEALLMEAMEKFGDVSHVEIDRRKGFAYVDFVDADGLKKAMAANPIPVGQGTVQVLQRKGSAPVQEKKLINHPPQNNAHNNAQNNSPLRGGRGGAGRGGMIGRRGGRGGGRGGGNVPANSEASKAPSSAPTGPATK